MLPTNAVPLEMFLVACTTHPSPYISVSCFCALASCTSCVLLHRFHVHSHSVHMHSHLVHVHGHSVHMHGHSVYMHSHSVYMHSSRGTHSPYI